MNRNIVVATLLALVLAVPARNGHTQTGDGSLRGYVRDEQGGLLPGVTVTATSPALLAPVVAVADSSGAYRLLNLPPGTYTLVAELTGFAAYRREGILMRAGSVFSVDIDMRLGTLAETITVSGESPMVEIGRPTSVITIDGELLRAAPLTSRRLWSDALDVAPGVGSRNVDDGSGNRSYYFHGADIFAHAFQLDGAPATAYSDFGSYNLNLSTEAVADMQIKIGGADASAPLSTGLVVNIVTQRGGNAFKGSASYAFQPLSWNGDNTQGGRERGGLPTLQRLNQFDASLGGPIVRNRAWFFSAYRWADQIIGISRTNAALDQLQTFRPDFEPFHNKSVSYQPYVKVTSRVGAQNEMSLVFQRDKYRLNSNRDFHTHPVEYSSGGGPLVQGRLTSVWSDSVSLEMSAAWNNKSSYESDRSAYEKLANAGPQVVVHREAFLSGGRLVGSGQLVQMNNVSSISVRPASLAILRADATFFKEGWAGLHELKAGVYAAPWNRYDVTSEIVNDGFGLEEVRLINPNNPGAGTIPFHRRFETPVSLDTTAARDRDIGIYVQDSWKPNPRLTANVGIRVDFVRRHDGVFDVPRMTSVEVGPRTGISYLITKDARNVLRASYGRVHEQVGGRDAITTFGTGGIVGTRREIRDLYDFDGDGAFETTIVTPAVIQGLSGYEFDSKLHQPFVDEFMLGFQKQFPGQISLDIAGTRRYYKDTYAIVDVNGIYPNAPNQPFVGFGRVDPNRGIFYQQTNNTWNKTVITALELVAAKNLSNNVQFMVSATRQWQKLDGTWNPTDPARFIQPDAFANDREVPLMRGNNEENNLDGRGRGVGAAWRPFSVRMTGQYFAPWNLVVGASYVIQAGDYSGPIVTRLPAGDPQVTMFGPATVLLPNGTRQPNPLATTVRFAFPTRGEGQVLNETVRLFQLKVGRDHKFGRQSLETAVMVFNLFNTGAFSQYAGGANQIYNTANYLRPFNRNQPRAFQLTATYRF